MTTSTNDTLNDLTSKAKETLPLELLIYIDEGTVTNVKHLLNSANYRYYIATRISGEEVYLKVSRKI